MPTIHDVKTLKFPELGDSGGNLIAIEGGETIPFDIKRIFYIYNTNKNVIRGRHANCRSEFCFINVSGSSKVKVVDHNGDEKTFILDRPYTGVYLPAMLWKDMYDFSADSVLLVLSNEHYDSTEYIRDYDNYLAEDI